MTELSPGGKALLRLWPDVRPYAGRIGLALGLILLSVVTSIAIPLVVKYVVDGPIARGEAKALVWPIAIVSVLGLVDSGVIWGRRRVGARPSAELETGMRAKVFAHAQRLAIGEHARWDSGQLLSRGVEDLRQLRRFVAFFGPFFVVNTAAIIAVTATLLVLCWPLGLVLIVCEIPMLAATSLLERAWNQVSRQVQDLVGDITTTVEESVLGIRVLKAFGAGDDSIAHYRAQADELRGLQLRETRLKATLWTVSGVTPVLAVAAMLLLSGWGVPNGQWTLGTLVAAISLVMYLNWPLTSIALLLGDMFNTMNAAARHWELMDRPISVAGPGRARLRKRRLRLPGLGVPSARRSVAARFARRDPGVRRPDRFGEDHPRESCAPVARRHLGTDHAGRLRHPRAPALGSARADRRGVRGARALLGERPGERGARQARGDGPGGRRRVGDRLRRRISSGNSRGGRRLASASRA